MWHDEDIKNTRIANIELIHCNFTVCFTSVSPLKAALADTKLSEPNPMNHLLLSDELSEMTKMQETLERAKFVKTTEIGKKRIRSLIKFRSLRSFFSKLGFNSKLSIIEPF